MIEWRLTNQEVARDIRSVQVYSRDQIQFTAFTGSIADLMSRIMQSDQSAAHLSRVVSHDECTHHLTGDACSLQPVMQFIANLNRLYL